MEDSHMYRVISDLVPRYDGNPKNLNFYIKQVDEVMRLIEIKGSANQILVCMIKNRLSGAAIDAIAYEEPLDSWDRIKCALIRRLGDPRTEVQLVQELMRTRRNKSEDSECYGKRLREILNILYSVGSNPDKSYYERMAIDQFISQLEFQISIGVRIANPSTLESAISVARQEETKIQYTNRSQSNNTPSTSSGKTRFEPPKPHVLPFRPHHPQIQPMFNPNTYVPQPNNLSPEQRQQLVNSVLPWRNKPAFTHSRNSGNFRAQPNIPQSNKQNNTDVTMRSVNKTNKPQFAFEELFYTPQVNTYPFTPAFPYYPVPYYYPIQYGLENENDETECEPDERNQEEVSDQQDFQLEEVQDGVS